MNAKQYRRIMKRREARAKLEARRKVAPQRKVRGHSGRARGREQPVDVSRLAAGIAV